MTAAHLQEYNQKRDFDKTSEPPGDMGAFGDGLCFVVQHHMARREHYDLRLEWKGVLLSWAVPKGPSYNTRDKRLAVQVEDHPLEYRNFEGTIPQGQYGGGVVMLWDEGLWEPRGNIEDGLQEGVLKFFLKGRRLKGKWALIRLKAKEGTAKNNWLLLKEKDDYVQADSGISALDTSIRTGRTMAEIEQGLTQPCIVNPFHQTQVQLAKLVTKVPSQDEDWLYEMKYDGYRILAYLQDNTLRLVSRNGNDYTRHFQDIDQPLLDLARGRAMVLDGEVVVINAAGKTDFQALQQYIKNPKKQHLAYIVFDLLALDGQDLRGRPLTERKELLENLMEDAPKNLHYSRHVKGNARASFSAACEADMEGIIGKKAKSLYSGTRNGDWIKLKCEKRQEFIIGGYTLTDKRTNGISSLLLGIYEGDKLLYAGRAGTGFSRRDMQELRKKFETLEREQSPFQPAPAPRTRETITWLEPKLVAEIKFIEWTKEQLLRQASFKGLRLDKAPQDIQREAQALPHID